MSDPTPGRTDPPGVAPIVTHRATPTGVLPRRGQVWVMVGVAGGILVIILFTGNHDPRPPRASGSATVAAQPPNPEQLRTYQRRLEAADTRPQAIPPTLQELRPMPPDDRSVDAQATPRPQDAFAEERRRREYDSLFASNVVQSPTLPTAERAGGAPRRPATGTSPDLGTTPPSLDDVADAVVRASAARTVAPPMAVAPPQATVGTTAPAAAAQPEITPADGPVHRLLEGTIIDATLTNRLDGSTAAPVNCLVSTPVYSSDLHVLIPAGARILGTTKPVQSFGETRLAVAFHRIAMPNGRTYSLEHFMGLNAIGDAGLRDQVNQHYASTFGVSAAVGLISGFAQYLGGGLFNRNDGPVIIAGNVADATAQVTTQTMSRFLNRLPTVTIREGHRVKVYLTSDLSLPVYHASQPDRGLRTVGRVQP